MIKGIKKKLIILLAICICANLLSGTAVFAKLGTEIKSPSAVLMDAATGAMLFEKNPHERLEPASITKIMTLLLTFEAIDNGEASPNDVIKISERAWKTGGSQVFLALGEEQTLETLTKCIIVASANDASVAVAEHIGGSYEGFVLKMNEKAKVLGMDNTSFKNPHGLSEEGHFSSAHDIAIMSKEMVAFDTFFRWSSTWLDYLEHTDRKRDATMLANTNKLLGKYEGLDGIKTGFHSKAGHCFVGTAKRDDFRLISVVLNADKTEDRFDDTVNLLDFGFGNFDSMQVIKKDSIQKSLVVEKGATSNVNIVASKDINILTPKGKGQTITTKMVIPEKLTAPIQKGEKVGSLTVERDEEILETIDLIVSDDIERVNFFGMMKKVFNKWIQL